MTTHALNRLYLVPALAALAACTSARPAEQGSAAVAALKPPAVDESNLDRAVNPCDDFYQFACGGWMAKTPIPPDRAQWSRSFSEIAERNVVTLREILESPPKEQPADPYARKLYDYYTTCMNEEKAETD